MRRYGKYFDDLGERQVTRCIKVIQRIRKKNRPLFAEDFYTLDDKVKEIVKETDRLRRRIERLETKRAELREEFNLRWFGVKYSPSTWTYWAEAIRRFFSLPQD